MKQYDASSLQDLFDASRQIRSDFGNRTWFRGHYRADWRLLPGAFRPDLNNGLDYYERLVAQMFLLRARARRKDAPPASDFASWMYLMQHYRLPTRLLDWSESLLVGAFFAVWNESDPRHVPPEEAEVFALAPRILNERQVGKKMVYLMTDPEARALVPDWMVEAGGAHAATRTENPPQALAIMPEQVDARMVAQQGAFTIHGPDIGLEELDGCENFLARIRIAGGGARDRIRQELLALGIRPMNLFPDLDHLSSDLKNFEDII